MRNYWVKGYGYISGLYKQLANCFSQKVTSVIFPHTKKVLKCQLNAVALNVILSHTHTKRQFSGTEYSARQC